LNGPESEVRGTGVVGRQPVLMPNESFEYTSACPLTCDLQQGCVPAQVIGSMRGEYQFVKGDTGGEAFEVEIPRFYFVLPKRIIEH
jgi:ApaG protein